MSSSRRVRVVGRGRAGGAFAAALTAIGWEVDLVRGRDGLELAGVDVDLVLLCVPDAAVPSCAASIRVADRPPVVAHVSGALGLSALGDQPRPGAVHPLLALSDAASGGAALRSGATFAVAGDPLCRELVDALRGTAIEVDDEHRVEYHAAAVIASNHLVGVLGQARRVAALAGVPFEAYLGLVRNTVDNVERLGPAAALTGPAARGDDATIAAHLEALPAEERAAYRAGVELCRALVAERGATDGTAS